MKAAPFEYIQPKTVAEASVALGRRGANTAAIADHPGVNTDMAAIGQQLADIDRLVCRGHFDAHVGRLRVDELHSLARGQNNVAAGRRDDAAVFDIGRDQIDRTAVRLDHALIAYIARAGSIGVTLPPGEKILVG